MCDNRQHGTESLATDARPVWLNTVRTAVQRYNARCNRRQPCELSSADADSRRAAEAVSQGCGAAPPGRVSGHCIARDPFRLPLPASAVASHCCLCASSVAPSTAVGRVLT